LLGGDLQPARRFPGGAFCFCSACRFSSATASRATTEVRTLREKIAILAATGTPGEWMRELSRDWMQDDPDEATYLYVDGHVRVYHGSDAVLPRRYVSRQKLCLRGTTDYWVNDALGRPFFVVSKAVTDGLATALLDDILPELLAAVPGQPNVEQLAADPLPHRFVVVFGSEEIPGTTQVINPAWRALDKQVAQLTTRLRKHQARLGAAPPPDPDDAPAIERRATLLETIQNLNADREQLKLRRRATPRKVAVSDLPESERPRQLHPLAKTLTDTVKMIAYRAETALVGLLRPRLANEAEARALVRELFVSGADLEPDDASGTLTVRVHRMALPVHDRAIALLLADLTEAAFRHPETSQRLIYQLV